MLHYAAMVETAKQCRGSELRAEVVILGGGLAGLTLALQLRQRLPQLHITVLERRSDPAPAAAFKVGEASVEIASHYFAEVLGLRAHLDTCHLRKFGFRFFFSHDSSDLPSVTELGQSTFLPTPTWQIERGIFENFLCERVREQGIGLEQGAVVRAVALSGGDADHAVRFELNGVEHEIAARWVIDATGRAGFLKRQLGLHRPNAHDANAAWFRIAARIDVGQWGGDARWQQRCQPPARWLSTNHLCGPGYWVWLIPLASGSHSVGIVADPAVHPLDTFDSFAKALEWLRRHQPRLAADLEGKHALLQDFHTCRHFSHDCKQVFSSARWALTGEAGVFLDPFYSPGGDYIAIANTYITELVARDRNGEPLSLYATLYERLFRSFYDSTLVLYTGQYPLFGDAEVMPLKVLWDYTYYWGVLCQLYFQQRLADLPLLGGLRAELMACMELNAAVQKVLLQWAGHNTPCNPPQLLDQAAVDWFVELNRGLGDRLSDAQVTARLRDNLALLATLARDLLGEAQRAHPGVDGSELLRLAARLAPAAPQAGPGCGSLFARLRIAV